MLRDSKEHVYFKILLKNAIYTTPNTCLKYVYMHIHMYLLKSGPLRPYSQSLHLDEHFLRYVRWHYLAPITLAPKKTILLYPYCSVVPLAHTEGHLKKFPNGVTITFIVEMVTRVSFTLPCVCTCSSMSDSLRPHELNIAYQAVLAIEFSR